jgi:hypothetical protein
MQLFDASGSLLFCRFGVEKIFSASPMLTTFTTQNGSACRLKFEEALMTVEEKMMRVWFLVGITTVVAAIAGNIFLELAAS